MISGLLAARIASTARRMSSSSASGRRIRHSRSARNSSGTSNASAWTSCGSEMVTAPVSAGSVSTRSPWWNAENNCSGRFTRSKNFERGRKASLTVMSYAYGCSSCCSTGSAARVAKVSDGSNSTGSRLVVASAAPVSRFEDPGPIEVLIANVWRRRVCRA